MNYQKMMNCKKYNTAESAGPLSLLLTAGGMESGTPIDIHASEDAAIVLRETMTAAEMVGAIQSLRTITANLLIHLAKVCGPCDSCDMGCPCLQAEEAFPVPDALLEEAGIPKGAKLDVFAENGRLTISVADAPDLRDVPTEMLDLLRQSGVCLDTLEELMIEEAVIYGV